MLCENRVWGLSLKQDIFALPLPKYLTFNHVRQLNKMSGTERNERSPKAMSRQQLAFSFEPIQLHLVYFLLT